MRLLPDITGIGFTLSIQDPYTINNQLIVDMYTNSTWSMYGNDDVDIVFKTEDNSSYAINRERLYDVYNHLIDRNRGIRFFDENEYEIRFTTCERYINLIQCQCNEFHTSTHFYDGAKNRLLVQNRIASYRNEGYYSSGRMYYSFPSVSTDNYIDTGIDRGTITFRNDDAISFTVNNNFFNRDLFRPYSAPGTTNEESFIHNYNYKPEYIKHRLANEEGSLLLGAEIEVAGNTDYTIDKNEVVKKCIQIMNGSDSVSEDLIYSTSDSTVQIELDTMPCSLEFHKQMNYKEMFKYLDEKGYKGHDCESAGLHIHADRSYLGNSELKQSLVISKILYILEKFNDEICVIARRNNSYSTFVGKEEVNKSLVKLYNKYNNTGKRVALNLQHPDTIEFRCFKSTLKYETFILTLEFVQDIINYAKSINVEDIELIQWADLMDTFSDDLKAYYEERKKKEEKKAATVKEDNSDYRYTQMIHGSRANAIRNDAVIRDVTDWVNGVSNATASISFSASEAARNLNNWRTELLSASDSLEALANQYNGSLELISETKESLEKKIKDIKKALRVVTNYMQKKKLQKELCDLRTELKKLKKKERNNSHNTNNVTSANTTNTSEINTPNETRATISWDLNNASSNNRIYAIDGSTLTTTNNDWCTATINYATSTISDTVGEICSHISY